MSKREVRWCGCGAAPKNCDTCGEKLVAVFYDAKTKMGPWANMCRSCFTLGPGLGKLGTGLGQEYTWQHGGFYLKTGG